MTQSEWRAAIEAAAEHDAEVKRLEAEARKLLVSEPKDPVRERMLQHASQRTVADLAGLMDPAWLKELQERMVKDMARDIEAKRMVEPWEHTEAKAKNLAIIERRYGPANPEQAAAKTLSALLGIGADAPGTMKQWHPTMQPERIREDQAEQRAEAGKADPFAKVGDEFTDRLGLTWTVVGVVSDMSIRLERQEHSITNGLVVTLDRLLSLYTRADRDAERPVPAPSPSSPNQDTRPPSETQQPTSTHIDEGLREVVRPYVSYLGVHNSCVVKDIVGLYTALLAWRHAK